MRPDRGFQVSRRGAVGGGDMVQSPEVPRIGLQQLLKVMIDKGASDLHITTAAPPLLRVDGSVLPLQLPPLGPIETKAALLLGSDRRAEDPLREEQRARSFVRRKEPVALPRQPLHAAGGGGGGVSRHPFQGAHVSTSSGCRRSSPSWRPSRAGSCSSPGPPGRANRPRSPRSSTRSTPRPASTS